MNLKKKEYAARLSFIIISWVSALQNILFKLFLFERFQYIKTCKKLQERLAKERRLISIIS